MSFDEMECLLGEGTVAAVQAAVRSAYVASDGRQEAQKALENLLIAMLVTVVVRPTNYRAADECIADCARRMADMARLTREEYESGSARKGH